MLKEAGRSMVLVLVILAATSPARAQDEERAAVLATVQQFLDAMAERDPAKALKAVIPEGRLYSVRVEAGAPVIRTFTFQEDLDRWAARSESVLERVWNSEIRVHGRIATVWTPYDFYRDGRFSHCGIDAFDLVKTAGGWRLTGGVYTVERESCPDSPLGPPQAGAADVPGTGAGVR